MGRSGRTLSGSELCQTIQLRRSLSARATLRGTKQVVAATQSSSAGLGNSSQDKCGHPAYGKTKKNGHKQYGGRRDGARSTVALFLAGIANRVPPEPVNPCSVYNRESALLHPTRPRFRQRPRGLATIASRPKPRLGRKACPRGSGWLRPRLCAAPFPDTASDPLS